MSDALKDQSILLVGLPGSGKTRVASSLHKQFGCQVVETASFEEMSMPAGVGCYEWNDFQQIPNTQHFQQVWCVIDVRSSLSADWLGAELRNLLTITDGIVFSFAESSSLDDQAWWNHWLKETYQTLGLNKPPIARWSNQSFSQTFTGFKFVNSISKQSDTNSDVIKPKVLEQGEALETFSFSLDSIVLDHLLMSLDNSRQNLSMKITRVTGILNTMEYENPVVLEGTPYRWDMFAAEKTDVPSELIVSGIGLNHSWLSELIHACQP